jgi:hypothetical protein
MPTTAISQITSSTNLTSAVSIPSSGPNPEPISAIGWSPAGGLYSFPGYPFPKVLLSGEKLIFQGATLINHCEIPISIAYFGQTLNEPSLRPPTDYELIYYVPDAPYPQILCYDTHPGNCYMIFHRENPFYTPSGYGPYYYLLAKITKEELIEIESSYTKPEKISKRSIKNLSLRA